jgi:hypothetical protein
MPLAKQAPRFPKYQASFAATHTTPVGDDWNIVARADVKLHGQALLPMRAIWRGWVITPWANVRLSAESDRLRISLFVENLFQSQGFVLGAALSRPDRRGQSVSPSSTPLLTPRRGRHYHFAPVLIAIG